MRKVVAVAAAPGLIAGIYIFIASFFGLTMDKLGAKAILLHLGIFALFIPLVLVERWSKGGDPFRGKPRWVVRSMQIFFLFVTVFLAFLALSHAASPEIVNGEYVLNSHGENSRVHFRERLSCPQRLGIAIICLRLDGVLLRTDNVLVVPPARRMDFGDA